MANRTCSKCGDICDRISRDGMTFTCLYCDCPNDILRNIRNRTTRKEKNWREQDVRREEKRQEERDSLANELLRTQEVINACLLRQAAYRLRLQNEATLRHIARLRAEANELELNL